MVAAGLTQAAASRRNQGRPGRVRLERGQAHGLADARRRGGDGGAARHGLHLDQRRRLVDLDPIAEPVQQPHMGFGPVAVPVPFAQHQGAAPVGMTVQRLGQSLAEQVQPLFRQGAAAEQDQFLARLGIGPPGLDVDGIGHDRHPVRQAGIVGRELLTRSLADEDQTIETGQPTAVAPGVDRIVRGSDPRVAVQDMGRLGQAAGHFGRRLELLVVFDDGRVQGRQNPPHRGIARLAPQARRNGQGVRTRRRRAARVADQGHGRLKPAVARQGADHGFHRIALLRAEVAASRQDDGDTHGLNLPSDQGTP